MSENPKGLAPSPLPVRVGTRRNGARVSRTTERNRESRKTAAARGKGEPERRDGERRRRGETKRGEGIEQPLGGGKRAHHRKEPRSEDGSRAKREKNKEKKKKKVDLVAKYRREVVGVRKSGDRLVRQGKLGE